MASRATTAERMLIGGELVTAESGAWDESINPANEEVIGRVPAGDKRDVKVKFPGDYPSAELKGKAASFAVTVKAVKTAGQAKADEEFAKLNPLGLPQETMVAAFRRQETMNRRRVPPARRHCGTNNLPRSVARPAHFLA